MNIESKIKNLRQKKLGTTKKNVISAKVGNKKLSFRIISASELDNTRNPAYSYLVNDNNEFKNSGGVSCL